MIKAGPPMHSTAPLQGILEIIYKLKVGLLPYEHFEIEDYFRHCGGYDEG